MEGYKINYDRPLNSHTDYSIPLDEILKAIEKNGLPQVRGSFWVNGYKDDVVTGACAIGMAAINLQVDYNDLQEGLNGINLHNHTEECGGEYACDVDWVAAGDYIISLNDEDNLPFSGIARHIRERYPESLTKEAKFSSYSFSIETVDLKHFNEMSMEGLIR